MCLLGSTMGLGAAHQEGSKPQNVQTSQVSDRHTLHHQSNSNQSLHGRKGHSESAHSGFVEHSTKRLGPP